MSISTDKKKLYFHRLCGSEKKHAAMCEDVPSHNRKTETNESKFGKGYQPTLFSSIKKCKALLKKLFRNAV